jgi:hypothetical protein
LWNCLADVLPEHPLSVENFHRCRIILQCGILALLRLLKDEVDTDDRTAPTH